MAKKVEDFKPRLEVADCEEWLNSLEPGSVDLALFDPPFNIQFEYSGYEDDKHPQEYVEWCLRWLRAVHRALKPSGTLWVCSGDKFVSFIDVMAQVGGEIPMLGRKGAAPGFNRRAWVVWYYTFGMNLQTNFTKSHTHLLYYTKHRTKFTFNKDDEQVRHASARQLVYNDKRANPKGRLPDDTWFLMLDQIQGVVQPFDDVWVQSRVAGTFKNRVEGQSCQMPEPILERIIRLCSNPGEMVIDCFLGSGSTCATAQKLGRRSAGCDVDPLAVERAKQLCGVV